MSSARLFDGIKALRRAAPEVETCPTCHRSLDDVAPPSASEKAKISLAWNDAFASWYRTYRRREAPGRAKVAFDKLKPTTMEAVPQRLAWICDRTARHLVAWKDREIQHVPLPATLLNELYLEVVHRLAGAP